MCDKSKYKYVGSKGQLLGSQWWQHQNKDHLPVWVSVIPRYGFLPSLFYTCDDLSFRWQINLLKVTHPVVVGSGSLRHLKLPFILLHYGCFSGHRFGTRVNNPRHHLSSFPEEGKGKTAISEIVQVWPIQDRRVKEGNGSWVPGQKDPTE